MTAVRAERVSAELDGDFVVFLIGARMNSLWKVHKWFPVFTAMPRMLAELATHAGAGLAACTASTSGSRMSWSCNIGAVSSICTATPPIALRPPAGLARLQPAVASNGDVGIWHETYLVRAGAYETVYNNMPPFGLGLAGHLVPAQGPRMSAKGRLGLPVRARLDLRGPIKRAPDSVEAI